MKILLTSLDFLLPASCSSVKREHSKPTVSFQLSQMFSFICCFHMKPVELTGFASENCWKEKNRSGLNESIRDTSDSHVYINFIQSDCRAEYSQMKKQAMRHRCHKDKEKKRWIRDACEDSEQEHPGDTFLIFPGNTMLTWISERASPPNTPWWSGLSPPPPGTNHQLYELIWLLFASHPQGHTRGVFQQ